jgi:hypothetical protein
MHQSVLTLASDVQPQSVDALRRSILAFKTIVENPPPGQAGSLVPYEQLAKAIPALHFASMMIFEDAHYDPLLTVELNFDGHAGSFLPQLDIAVIDPYLRAMIRCCKRPTNATGALYDAVTAPGSKLPLAPFLETCIVRPAVFHQGSRGLDRSRILSEYALFTDVQVEIAASSAIYRETGATGLHAALRAALIGKYPWLDMPEPACISLGERVADIARLVAFLAIGVFCLSVPGILMALVGPARSVILVCLIAAAIVFSVVPGFWTLFRPDPLAPPDPPDLPPVPATPPIAYLKAAGVVVAFVVGYLIVAALVLAVIGVILSGSAPLSVYRASLGVAAAGLFAIPLSGALLLLWLRWIENRDPVQESPHDDPKKLRDILALEDQIAQNHMGSVVLIKPGILRAVLVRVGLRGLGYLLRVTATDGYLGSMRTIHFAHWAILSNGGRLAFFSNFDSSWESYLDDFIEKAHVGLTLAWSHGVGFPSSRFLVLDGATNGRLFKAWARHSMAEGLFWFSAYKDLSVNQIERQYRIARGLRRKTLSEEEASLWAQDL